VLDLGVHHEYGIGACADHSLDRGPDKDIPQQVPAMRAEDDQIGIDCARHAQNAVKWVTANDHRAALRFSQFGNRADLLSKDPSSLATLDFDEVLRLVIIHDMNQSKLGGSSLRQQACAP
jgi:hypothetical protein